MLMTISRLTGQKDHDVREETGVTRPMEPGECQVEVTVGFRFHGCEVNTIVNRDDNTKRLR
jgi:hypothetical protein